MPTSPKYQPGDLTTVKSTSTTQQKGLAGKTVRIVSRDGDGLYTVTTKYGKTRHTVRAPQHI